MEERLGEVIGSFLNALFGLVEVVNAATEKHKRKLMCDQKEMRHVNTMTVAVLLC